MAAGRAKEAAAALRTLVEQGGATTDDLRDAALLASELGSHTDASSFASRALERNPGDEVMRSTLRASEAAVREEEIEKLRRAVAEGHAGEEDRRRLAALFVEGGRKQEALALILALPGENKGDPDASYLKFAAEHHAREGRIAQAEEALRALARHFAYAQGSEQEKALLYRVAALFEKHGARTDARRVYLELYGRDPAYRDVSAKLDGLDEVVESGDGGATRALASLVERRPREIRTIFEALRDVDLTLDPALIALARAKSGGGR
jgi:hypothetical protein